MFRLILAAAVALAAPALHAAPMTLEQVAEMRHVTEVAIAPGGGRVAYRIAVPRRPFAEDDGSAWHELHVADARGNSRGYVVGQVSIRQPRWFPDGQAIAFLDRPLHGIIVLIFFVLYQQLENHVLQPLVYSRTVQLSPLAILIAVLIGASLAGILGALAAIPVAGTIQVVFLDWLRARRASDEPIAEVPL
jgi:hypothetical protein